MPDTILLVKNLNIAFGESTVVSNLNIALKKGKTLAIVGESGSGKSVTSLALMGLLPKNATVTADALTFAETDLRTATENKFRQLRGKRISMIFQEPMTSLNPAMRCGRQVAEVLQLHENASREAAKKTVLDWFEKVKLPDPEAVFNKYPHQLSGGQRQRVMIAMALCTRPELIIADEPTTALDVTVQKNILRLLRELQTEMGLAMIFITHDLGVVKEVADDVLVLFRGEVQEFGPVEQIINNPQAAYTKGLLACRPPLSGKPKRLQTVEDYTVEGLKSKVQSPMPITFEGDQKRFGVANSQDYVQTSKLEPQTSNFKPQTSPDSYRDLKLQTSDPILTISNLHKFFTQPAKGFFKAAEKIEVLKGISIEVFKGESLGLVGESGCGKSTLGRNIIRLLEPEAGQIVYKGNDITHLKGEALRKLRKEIQIIFQDPYSSLNPRQTIGDAITEPMRVHHLHGNDAARKAKTEELLEKVGLKAEHFNRYPHEFSGGQRQRIGIARALAVQPELIICDESVSALDVSVQAQVLNLLNDLEDEFGLTYLFISHDLSVVRYFCDRIAVLNKGEIVELNAADTVFFSPQNSYTQTLISAIPGR